MEATDDLETRNFCAHVNRHVNLDKLRKSVIIKTLKNWGIKVSTEMRR